MHALHGQEHALPAQQRHPCALCGVPVGTARTMPHTPPSAQARGDAAHFFFPLLTSML
jgi:hypothetical protein